VAFPRSWSTARRDSWCQRPRRRRSPTRCAPYSTIPLGRLADPREVGEIIAWLVSERNTYATGAEFDITGGLALH